jgi:hypothetical protein
LIYPLAFSLTIGKILSASKAPSSPSNFAKNCSNENKNSNNNKRNSDKSKNFQHAQVHGEN